MNDDDNDDDDNDSGDDDDDNGDYDDVEDYGPKQGTKWRIMKWLMNDDNSE